VARRLDSRVRPTCGEAARGGPTFALGSGSGAASASAIALFARGGQHAIPRGQCLSTLYGCSIIIKDGGARENGGAAPSCLEPGGEGGGDGLRGRQLLLDRRAAARADLRLERAELLLELRLGHLPTRPDACQDLVWREGAASSVNRDARPRPATHLELGKVDVELRAHLPGPEPAVVGQLCAPRAHTNK
jgi:hypothetical protein